MVKLYKSEDGRLLYWEAWEAQGRRAIIHWGQVGHRGEMEIRSGFFTGLSQRISKEAEAKEREGYSPIAEEAMTIIEVEFNLDGWGSETDLERRHMIEERLNQLLGWHGLGHVDGGSIGSGTMEVGCMVVDFDIAKRVIEQDLKGPEFNDFSRVY